MKIYTYLLAGNDNQFVTRWEEIDTGLLLHWSNIVSDAQHFKTPEEAFAFKRRHDHGKSLRVIVAETNVERTVML